MPRPNTFGWVAAGLGAALSALMFARARPTGRSAAAARQPRERATGSAGAPDKTTEDRERAGTSDDVMGISHGGGRDQYGGSFGGGQSGGGTYANPHTGTPPGQGGNRYGNQRGAAETTGGQSGQGYYGGGQMGDRNDSDNSHAAASKVGGPEHGEADYRAHPSQRGEDVDDALAASLRGAGLDDHRGFGAEHKGQRAQGVEHGGPHIDPDPEPG